MEKYGATHLNLTKIDGIPEDIAKALQEKVADTTIILTAKGLVLVNPIDQKAQGAVYKISEEKAGKVNLEIQPLDGSKTYTAQISSSGDALTLVTNNSSNAIHLAAHKVASEQGLLKKYFKKNDVEFLGDDASNVMAILN